MRKTTNYGLVLYDTTDKMNITGSEDSLNASMEIIDSKLKEIANNPSSGGGTSDYQNGTWICFGDSITDIDNRHTEYYFSVASQMLGITNVVNHGKSGYGLKEIYGVFKNSTETEADIVTVFGGVNDNWKNTSIGEFGDTSENTIYGIIYNFINGLTTKFPTATIVFITPPQWSSEHENGTPIKDIATAIKRVCGAYSIPVYDYYSCSGLNPRIPALKSTYTIDGLHLNDAGHIKFGKNLARFIMGGCSSNFTDFEVTESKPSVDIYTVTFDTQGGTSIVSQQIVSGNVAVRPSDPVKDNNNFLGWYTDSAGTNAFDFSTPITSDITLYAKWTELSVYIVTFETNGGTTVSAQNVLEGETATEPTAPSYTGHKFSGWYSDSELTIEFNFSTKITENITLYAKWTELAKYTVTYNSNGGSSVSAEQVYEGETATEPSKPSKDGFKFVSWCIDSELVTSFDFSTPITRDITLYAKWVDESEIWTGVTGTITQTRSNTLTLTALLEIDSDFVNGSKVASQISINNLQNMDTSKTQIYSTGNLFAGNVKTAKYSQAGSPTQVSGNTNTVLSVSGDTLTATNNWSINADVSEYTYLMVPIAIQTTSVPASFTFKDVNITVDGKKKVPVLFDGFFDDNKITFDNVQ